MLFLGWLVTTATALAPGVLATLWVVAASAVTFSAGFAGVHRAGRVAVLYRSGGGRRAAAGAPAKRAGAVLLVGLPWLALFAGSSLVDVGRITLFTPGDDFTHFQRFAYRIYMQGFWLEGGQWTFLVPAALSMDNRPHPYRVRRLQHRRMVSGRGLSARRRVVRFRRVQPGRIVPLGDCSGRLGCSRPSRSVRRGGLSGAILSEITAAGFAYTAALLLVGQRRHELWRAAVAGVLAVLCFYTRLNHLPWLFTLIALLVPLDVDAGALWRPRAWLARVPIRSAAVIVASLLVGLGLFALAHVVLHGRLQACFTERSGSSSPPYSPLTRSRRRLAT